MNLIRNSLMFLLLPILVGCMGSPEELSDLYRSVPPPDYLDAGQKFRISSGAGKATNGTVVMKGRIGKIGRGVKGSNSSIEVKTGLIRDVHDLDE